MAASEAVLSRQSAKLHATHLEIQPRPPIPPPHPWGYGLHPLPKPPQCPLRLSPVHPVSTHTSPSAACGLWPQGAAQHEPTLIPTSTLLAAFSFWLRDVVSEKGYLNGRCFPNLQYYPRCLPT